MRPSKYFYDKPLPKYLDSKTVSLKFHPLKHIIPIVTINILLGRRGVERGGIKIPGKLGRGGRAGWGRWRWGGDPNSDKNFDERSRVAILF